MGQLARKTMLACTALTVCTGWLLVAAPAARPAADGWAWPVEGRVVTPYANDDARPYAGGMHRGIDIAAPAGTRVVAARSGEVTYAGSLGYSGLTVAVRSADGRHVASYLHLGAVSVRRGQAVSAGERLGEVGTTGRRSVAEPHLHFGVRLGEDERHYVDPLSLLPALGPAQPAAPVPARVPVPVAARPAPARVPVVATPRVRRRAPAGGRVLPHPRGARAPVAVPGPAVFQPALRARSGHHAGAARSQAGLQRKDGHFPASVPFGSLQPRHGPRHASQPAIPGRDHAAAQPARPPAHPGADTGRLLLWAGLAVLALALAAPILRHGLAAAPALRLSSLRRRLPAPVPALNWRRKEGAPARAGADTAAPAEGEC